MATSGPAAQAVTDAAFPWKVVGEYRVHEASSHASGEFPFAKEADALSQQPPILLYDMEHLDEDGMPAPRYIARKIAIPPPSLDKVKVVSLGPPLNVALGQAPDVVQPNYDSAQKDENMVPKDRRKVKREQMHLVTSFPSPYQWAYIFPAVLFLLDVALLACGLATQKTSKRFIAAACIVILVPDIGYLFLLVKRGIITVTIAIHLVLWPNTVLAFVLPFISLLFILHIVVVTLMMIFALRIRKSLFDTVCTLS